MRFHRTSNTLPAHLTVTLASHSSFPAHDLAAETGPAQRVLQAENFSGGGSGTRSFPSREVRGLLLPFAVPLLSHNHLAAA
jgi:hypothetical protein